MSRLTDDLRRVTADGRLFRSEWNEVLAPDVKELPKSASPDGRALLEAFANSDLKYDTVGTRELYQRGLMTLGYDPADPRPEHLTNRSYFDLLARTNVSESDPELGRLSAATGRNSGDVTVGLLDAGFEIDHPGLAGKAWTNPGEIAGDGIDNDANGKVDDVHGWNFKDNNSALKSNPHGTHVFGIATAGTDRIKAVTDIAVGVGVHEVVQAIDDAAARGARVINMSFSSEDEEMTRLIMDAIKRHPDILFVKSAGNDGRDLSSFDAATYLGKHELPNMAVVSAANANGTMRSGSNYGAPYSTHATLGTQVYSTVDGAGYDWYGGTSMATPNVTNAASKLLLLDDKLTPAQLKGILADTVDVSEAWRARTASAGLINTDRAMRLAALTGLMRSGATPDAAADQIGLYGDERAQLLGLAGRYV